MARTQPLRQASDWFRTSTEPRFDRLKLGGIHRAQPYSHHFEAGRFRQSYIAEWAHFTKEARIRWYETIRLARQRLTEVPPQQQAVEKLEMSKGDLLRFAEELSVPIAGVAIFAELAHMPHTAIAGFDVLPHVADAANAAAAAADRAAATADLTNAVQALSEGIGHIAGAVGNIS
jgi:hypothetical protein